MRVPVSDPDVQVAAAFAIEAYNKASTNSFYSRALRVLLASHQVEQPREREEERGDLKRALGRSSLQGPS